MRGEVAAHGEKDDILTIKGCSVRIVWFYFCETNQRLEPKDKRLQKYVQSKGDLHYKLLFGTRMAPNAIQTEITF